MTTKTAIKVQMILYTDTIDGEQARRDDLWAISTSELAGHGLLPAPTELKLFTPPAPEVEPVAWRRTERDICDEYCTVYYDEETAPAGKGWEPLYTHPANDRLRKAAEEAIELLIAIWQGDKGVDWQESELEEKAYNLRSELNK